MRKLTSHKINPCNDQLDITVLDQPGAGGACHCYQISGYKVATNPGIDVLDDAGSDCGDVTTILFQNGPIKEAGVNGVTHETMLAVLEDRLVGFQAGPYACDENSIALGLIRETQRVLNSRTQKRVERGVEGTHEV